jgi:adenine-specific DNA-methyltransferase
LAVCVTEGEQEVQRLPIAALVAVKRDGEAVFPSLRPVARIEKGGNAPHHLVIESENHSALQMLRWLYSGKVDCIYIDPPYNTGAKVWKYNNDYVDKNDAYLVSKWLSMMERRLEIAKDLLAPDGILIIAIDDYEFAHLSTLLESSRLFRRWSLAPVVVQHNPRGGGGDKVSRTHDRTVPRRESSLVHARVHMACTFR